MGLPPYPTSGAGGRIGRSSWLRRLGPQWRASAAAVAVFVVVCEWLTPRLQTDPPGFGMVSTIDYSWPPLAFAGGALVVALCVALLSLPAGLGRDRRLVIGSIGVGGALTAAMGVSLLAVLYASSSSADDGADVGGPFIALVAAAAIAAMVVAVVARQASEPTEAVRFVSLWLGVVLFAILAGVSATDIGFVFRAGFDVTLSAILMVSAAGIGGAIGAVLRKRRA